MSKSQDAKKSVKKEPLKTPKEKKEEKIKHVEIMERLLDKQRVLYTRMSLSDDPEAIEMKERIMHSAIMMGMSPGTDMNLILNNMSKMLEVMKEQIDKTGSDL